MLAVENVREPMRFKTSTATANDVARKKIQAKHTNCTVMNVRATRDHHFVDGRGLPRIPWTARVIASPHPCSRPQTAKFQLAPCHSPPITIVTIRFVYVKIFHFDRRPGSEK